VILDDRQHGNPQARIFLGERKSNCALALIKLRKKERAVVKRVSLSTLAPQQGVQSSMR
jgi:hypothetical protein